MLSLNFPENLEVKVLAEYVSQRLKMNILYDDQIGNRRITLKAPSQIPADSLLGLLESVLKIKGLALVDAEQPGWKRIVQAADLIQVAKLPGQVEDGDKPGAAVTQMFTLERADPKRVEQIIKPFLTQPGANVFTIAERNMLVVTEYTTNMPRVESLIRLMDQPQASLGMEFVPAQHMEASQIAQQVMQLISARQKAQGLTTAGPMGEGLELTFDARTNRVVIIGSKARINDAKALITQLDVPLPVTTTVYQFKSASAERIDRLAKQLIDPVLAKRIYQSAIDREANLLIVTTTPEIHSRIAALQDGLDRPIAEQQSPVRFYRLMNATAVDVLQTIQSIQGANGLAGVTADGLTDFATANNGTDSLRGATGGTGISRVPGDPGNPGNPGDLGSPDTTAYDENTSGMQPVVSPLSPTALAKNNDNASDANNGLSSIDPAAMSSLNKNNLDQQVVVTADPMTNSIVVVAPPEVQRVYEQLIRTLDRRRPQVLVEVTVVTIDTTNNFSLGVEISKSGTFENGKTLSFSSFGLSEVDADTGQLTLTPGLGFNGAIISADVADVVIRALSANSRARVSSAPKILVNDNATGLLSSVNEAPFTTVNTSNSVSSSTTFGGFVTAGTTITVTPHIGEGDHLQLEYNVALNNFTDKGSGGVPPPRQTNAIESTITVPDGNTIIVGGLTRTSDQFSKQGIPFLEQIPVFEYLFSNRTETKERSTLFVFIRPIILRDDQFKDLKHLSERDLIAAEVPDANYPSSEPTMMR